MTMKECNEFNNKLNPAMIGQLSEDFWTTTGLDFKDDKFVLTITLEIPNEQLDNVVDKVLCGKGGSK